MEKTIGLQYQREVCVHGAKVGLRWLIRLLSDIDQRRTANTNQNQPYTFVYMYALTTFLVSS